MRPPISGSTTAPAWRAASACPAASWSDPTRSTTWPPCSGSPETNWRWWGRCAAGHAFSASNGNHTRGRALRQRSPGDARNAITALLGSHSNVKHVFVVDPDIDVYSDEQMEWALSTRFQADRDLIVLAGMRGN